MSGRNVELTREAGRLRRLGRSPEEIEGELLNHRSRNGLPPAEIRAIARSIGAKPPGPKIERPAEDGGRLAMSSPAAGAGPFPRLRRWGLSRKAAKYISRCGRPAGRWSAGGAGGRITSSSKALARRP
jgi:hypothetical protein